MKRLIAILLRHILAFHYVLTILLPAILRTRKRPVIFSKYSGIGDMTCTFPAALELKKRHLNAVFIYNCHSEFACLPKMAGVTLLVTSLRHIGIVEYWYSFLLSGFYQFASDDDRPEVIPTEVYIKDFGRQFGVELGDEHPRLTSDELIVSKMEARFKPLQNSGHPLVIIHPGPSWPVREWPSKSWNDLVCALRERGFTNIVQIGTSVHQLTPGALNAISVPGALSAVDQLSLAESIALISIADLFIGIDSGMLHIAAAVQTPAVGLWGPTSAHLRFSEANSRLFVTSPVECQGCHHRVPRLHWVTGCPYDIKCMKAISVETVFDACVSELEKLVKASLPE